MTITFQRVQSGDLVTANLMNQMMAAIESLDTRLNSMTSSVPSNVLAITQVLPAGTVRVGDKLQIIGGGFSSTPSLNLVTIGGVPVNVETGSTTSLLLVFVPGLPGLPGDGTGLPVTLSVSNTKGTVTSSLSVASPDVFQAQLLVSNTAAPPDAQILPNTSKTYTYQFTVTVFTTKDETFLFTPSVDLGWAAVATPASKLVQKTTGFTGTPVTVNVDVTVPSLAAGVKGKLTVTAKSQSNPSLKNTNAVDITVGSAPIAAQGDFTVAFANAVDGAASIAIDGAVELPKVGTLGEIDFQAGFKSTAQPNSKYNVTATIDKPTGWTITLVNPPILNVGTVPAFAPIAVQLTASAAAQPANLVVKATLQTDATKFATGSQPIRAK